MQQIKSSGYRSVASVSEWVRSLVADWLFVTYDRGRLKMRDTRSEVIREASQDEQTDSALRWTELQEQKTSPVQKSGQLKARNLSLMWWMLVSAEAASGRLRVRCQQHDATETTCLVSILQTDDNVRRMFSWLLKTNAMITQKPKRVSSQCSDEVGKGS